MPWIAILLLIPRKPHIKVTIMKLTHLGASYTPSTQTVETIETDTKLCFRGRTFKMRAPKAMPAQSAARSLTYRGVRYTA